MDNTVEQPQDSLVLVLTCIAEALSTHFFAWLIEVFNGTVFVFLCSCAVLPIASEFPGR